MTTGSFLTVPGDSETAIRLFCFPHAGGGSAQYYNWKRLLPRSIQVCPVQLPGREYRHRETPYRDLDLLTEDLACELADWVSTPYALYGHSMGAHIAFGLCRRFRARRLPLPLHLFVSSANPPQATGADPPLDGLSDRELIESAQEKYRGIPERILADPEYLQLILPALRADFAMLNRRTYSEEEPFAFPISVFGGRDDPHFPESSLKDWERHTIGPATLRFFQGDHFFWHGDPRPLTDALSAALTATQSGNSGPDAKRPGSERPLPRLSDRASRLSADRS